MFLMYPKENMAHSFNKDVFSRLKSSALNYLLPESNTFGSIQSKMKAEDRKRDALCSEATYIVVFLCTDGSGTRDQSSLVPDLTSVRKLVLESTSRSIKDAWNIENAKL